MTISFEVRSDITEATRYLTDVQHKVVPRVTVQALNEVAKQIHTLSAREIKKHRAGLKVGTIKKAIRTEKASITRQVARVIASGNPIPIMEFAGRPTHKGVTVNVSGTRKLIAGAFLVKKFGNSAFKRRGAARLPVDKLFGPSIPTAFIKEPVRRAQEALLDSKWAPVFENKLAFALSKIKG